MPLPASFDQFLGNTAAVEQLRAAIAQDRLPHSMIVGGPRGAGKYTLALMLAMAVECLRQPRSTGPNGRPLAGFCGVCTHCTRIAAAHDLQARVAEAVAAREEMRETDKKETRVLIQTHPDVLIVPPDPPQLLIKLGQVRSLIARSRRLPVEARRTIAIVTAASFMKEAANSLLKLLEEPPDSVHLILLAENPSELLPTIRSRCAVVRLGAVPADELETILAEAHPTWQPKQRQLVARLAQGAVGQAVGFQLEPYLASRADALLLLRTGIAEADHSALFRMTESYRAGAEGQAKTTALLRAMTLLLEDLLMLKSGAPQMVRNLDLRAELSGFSEAITFRWIESASHALDQVQSGMRRNLLRSLSLDAFAAQLSTTS
jgi:DNA polymerase-3 subunit delta'